MYIRRSATKDRRIGMSTAQGRRIRMSSTQGRRIRLSTTQGRRIELPSLNIIIYIPPPSPFVNCRIRMSAAQGRRTGLRIRISQAIWDALLSDKESSGKYMTVSSSAPLFA
jgi:hypothetical protein